jgi:tryptophan-rich sensory protein
MRNKSQSKNNIKFIPLIISLLIPLALGLIVYLLIPNMKILYETLEKPFFALPSIVFPIAWAILYILMGIASYKVYTGKYQNMDVSSALFVYGIQLLLNILWSFIFFSFRLYGLAFIELLILFVFVILTLIRFYQKSGIKAAVLLVPYLFWIIYAGILNFFIWMLNEM